LCATDLWLRSLHHTAGNRARADFALIVPSWPINVTTMIS
jgi:hypothetical protein